MNCWSQKIIKKDSLFFHFDKNYMKINNNNYDKRYFFQLKNEKIVTSAFHKITNDDLFYFVQTTDKTIKLNSKKSIDLKNFISKNSKLFIEKSTRKLDSYKLMQFFDQYTVFFFVKNKYYTVKASGTLPE